MSKQDSGPRAAVSGAVEGAKGKAKEVAGTLIDNDDLEEEGRAQRAKAGAQRDVAHHEAAAEKARVEASAREALQRRHQ